ncbi:MAG: T9SS type A sorting domain-containing protein [Bacteroidales bacterium]|nr:T9SS type A sorting domain-containing protein [Bacteroidales bacterium]
MSTKNYPYALFSYAACWNAVNCFYSEDQGSNWTQFTDAQQSDYEGGWRFIQFGENIGGKEEIYIKIEFTDGTPQIDDPLVMGYAAAPINKFVLNTAISSAEAFFSEAGIDPAYCINDLMDFKNNDIAAAQTVADNADATQTEVDAAAATLNEALDALKAKKLDFTTINEAIATADAKMAEAGYADSYTPESRSVMETALTAAKNITSTGCVTQEEVNTAATALNDAVSGLQNVGIDGSEITGIKLYPNPANDYIKIDGIEGETIYIVTVDGKTVKAINNYNGSTIGISNLTSGVYSVVVGDKTISFIKK